MLDSVYRFLNYLGYSHPIHPTEVHMPIGLVVATVLFSLTAIVLHKPALFKTAYYCIVLSFIWVFPTILFGIMDWQHFYAGALLFPIKVKLILAPLLAVLLLFALLLSRRGREGTPAVMAVYGLSFMTVVALGYFGGQMVYGVKNISASEQLQAGARLFKANCNACHPNGGNVIMPNLPLKSSLKLSDYDRFIEFIRHPKLPGGALGAMPPFPDSKLSDRDAKALYEYVTQALK